MFDLRPGKLALRREFESRVWRGGEPFCDYYHDKMILANRIPIAEDEILDYLIEGVMDQRLQNQARMMNYRTGTELLKAFEKVRPEDGRPGDAGARKDGVRTISGRGSEVSSTRNNPVKCFRWVTSRYTADGGQLRVHKERVTCADQRSIWRRIARSVAHVTCAGQGSTWRGIARNVVGPRCRGIFRERCRQMSSCRNRT